MHTGESADGLNVTLTIKLPLQGKKLSILSEESGKNTPVESDACKHPRGIFFKELSLSFNVWLL